MALNKYLGLLRWSLNYSDGTGENSVEAMDPERRQWLKEAMEAQTVDPVDQMKALVKVIQTPRGEISNQTKEGNDEQGKDQPQDDYVTKIVESLQLLQEWVEQIDWAMDLHKIGGFKTVIDLFSSEDEPIRVHALEVFATVVQNNPKPQEWALELGALPKLVQNFEKSDISQTEMTKTLLALSSLVRDCTPATVSFIKEHKGVASLVKVVRDEQGVYPIQARRKALFFMRYLLNTVPVIRIVLAELLVQTLKSTMLVEDIDLRENSLHLLISLYQDHNVREKLSDEATASVREELAKFAKGSSHFTGLDETTIELAKQLDQLAIQPPVVPPSAPEDQQLLLGN